MAQATLRKILDYLDKSGGPEEIEKFMDTPLYVQLRSPSGHTKFVEVFDTWPSRDEPRKEIRMADGEVIVEATPGFIRLIAYPDFNFVKARGK